MNAQNYNKKRSILIQLNAFKLLWVHGSMEPYKIQTFFWYKSVILINRVSIIYTIWLENITKENTRLYFCSPLEPSSGQYFTDLRRVLVVSRNIVYCLLSYCFSVKPYILGLLCWFAKSQKWAFSIIMWYWMYEN